MKRGLLVLMICGIFFAQPVHAAKDPSCQQALLQQLHPVVTGSLKKIFKLHYVQYTDAKIISINRVDLSSGKRMNNVVPVDAIGGSFFEIKVEIKMHPSQEIVQLILINDRPRGSYRLKEFVKGTAK